MLSSTQQLLKIAQEQLFKGASSQGETRGQMCEPRKRQISLKRRHYSPLLAGCLTSTKLALTPSVCATSAPHVLAPAKYCDIFFMYELEREEHIVTHGQLEEVPRAKFRSQIPFHIVSAGSA